MKPRKTDHPILFSTPMVQAILINMKSKTRRTRGLENINENPDAYYLQTLFLHATGRFTFAPVCFSPGSLSDSDIIECKCPYGQPGDKLWVRETFIEYAPNQFEYKSGFTDEPIKWKPSIHMPKSAARIWLEITEVRVERLRDITEEDAKAEGAECQLWQTLNNTDTTSHRNGFTTLWISINGDESWNKNPWVWVISFKRIDK